jgi:hypothetical protein
MKFESKAHMAQDGAVIQVKGDDEWCDAPSPNWIENAEYRIKPQTQTVYEWIHSTSLGSAYGYYTIFLHADDVEFYFGGEEFAYRSKTGRSWEVEV